MRAFDRYNRRLSTDEHDRYLREQARIGRMGGADRVPESLAELDEYIERMRSQMAFTEQTRSFVDFLCGDTGGPDAASARERRLSLKASMSLMPEWSRKLTRLDLPPLARRGHADPYNTLVARALRWAHGTPPFKSMALDRVGAAVQVAA